MSFKLRNFVKKHEGENEKMGMSIKIKIPLFFGILIAISMVTISIFTYIKSSQIISNQSQIRQAVEQLAQGV